MRGIETAASAVANFYVHNLTSQLEGERLYEGSVPLPSNPWAILSSRFPNYRDTIFELAKIITKQEVVRDSAVPFPETETWRGLYFTDIYPIETQFFLADLLQGRLERNRGRERMLPKKVLPEAHAILSEVGLDKGVLCPLRHQNIDLEEVVIKVLGGTLKLESKRF